MNTHNQPTEPIVDSNAIVAVGVTFVTRKKNLYLRNIANTAFDSTAIVALLLLCYYTKYLQLDPNTAFIFQNFYCSHISIKQLQQRSQNNSSSESLHSIEQQQWITVLPHYALMASPHYEDDAQHWHVLPVSALNAAFDAADTAAPLRVFLHQPSPMWDSMELRHFKCAVLPDPAEVCVVLLYCRLLLLICPLTLVLQGLPSDNCLAARVLTCCTRTVFGTCVARLQTTALT